MAVVGITPEDAVDNFAILAALAGKAAEMATGRITPDELRDLRELAGAIDDADDVVAANRRFHRAINLAARSPRLLTYLRQAVSGSCRATTSSSSPSRRSGAGTSTPRCSTRWSRATAPGARSPHGGTCADAGEALGGLAGRGRRRRATLEGPARPVRW